MKKIIPIIIFIIVLLFIGVFVGYLMDNDGHLNDKDAQILGISIQNKTELTLYSNPMSLDVFINEITCEPYYKGYDENTLRWMKLLGQKEVFVSDDSFIIMDKEDAHKINPVYVTDIATTDTYEEYYIDCIIVENRSLGHMSRNNVLLVKNVNVRGNQTFYYEV